MPLIVWKPEYAVGNRELDAQHQTLMNLINELHEGMLHGKGAEVLHTVLDQLVRYTKSHFAAEEHYMREARYPGLAAHHQEHEALTKQVELFIVDIRSGKLALSLQISKFLKDWLDHHILGSDQLYVRHCRMLRTAGPQLVAR
jgi:hemerythrin